MRVFQIVISLFVVALIVSSCLSSGTEQPLFVGELYFYSPRKNGPVLVYDFTQTIVDERCQAKVQIVLSDQGSSVVVDTINYDLPKSIDSVCSLDEESDIREKYVLSCQISNTEQKVRFFFLDQKNVHDDEAILVFSDRVGFLRLHNLKSDTSLKLSKSSKMPHSSILYLQEKVEEVLRSNLLEI